MRFHFKLWVNLYRQPHTTVKSLDRKSLETRRFQAMVDLYSPHRVYEVPDAPQRPEDGHRRGVTVKGAVKANFETRKSRDRLNMLKPGAFKLWVRSIESKL
jgi:hypothetical protein